MRTTVTLDEDVEHMLKAAMHSSRKPFKQVLNAAVRAGLRGNEKSKRKPFKVQARRLGLRPEFEGLSFNEILNQLDAEEFQKINVKK